RSPTRVIKGSVPRVARHQGGSEPISSRFSPSSHIPVNPPFSALCSSSRTAADGLQRKVYVSHSVKRLGVFGPSRRFIFSSPQATSAPPSSPPPSIPTAPSAPPCKHSFPG